MEIGGGGLYNATRADGPPGAIMNRHNSFFLTVIVLWAALVGCASDSAEPAPAIVEPSAVQLLLAADDFAVGTARLPFVLYDGPDVLTTAQTVTLTVVDLRDDSLTPVWTGAATFYADSPVPYWVAYPDLPEAAQWGLVFDVTLAAGSVESVPRRLNVAAQTAAPAVGSPAPAVTHPTLADEPLERLSSAESPDPALYQTTIAAALASGRPTIISFSTPAFCATELCAPALDSFTSVATRFAGRVNAVHIEIFDMARYRDSESADLVVAAPVRAWNLTSEPWTYVIDADGVVAARLAGPVAASELTAAVEAVLP